MVFRILHGLSRLKESGIETGWKKLENSVGLLIMWSETGGYHYDKGYFAKILAQNGIDDKIVVFHVNRSADFVTDTVSIYSLRVKKSAKL